MKKLAVFLFLAAVVSGTAVLPKSLSAQTEVLKSATIVTDLATAESLGEDFVMSGSDAIISVETSDFHEIIEKYQAKAVIFCLEKQNFEKLAKTLKLQKMSKVSLEEIEVEYYYTPLFSESYLSQGRKINAEVAWRGDDVVIGFPRILTGY